MPSIELALSCSDVPFKVTLYKLAVPLNKLVPVKVVVPAEAEKLPVTARTDVIVRFVEVLTLPETVRLNKLMEPTAEIIFDVPLIVTLPAVLVKLPPEEAVKFPVSVKTAVVDTVPERVRSFKVKPVPEIVFVVPVMVMAPVE